MALVGDLARHRCRCGAAVRCRAAVWCAVSVSCGGSDTWAVCLAHLKPPGCVSNTCSIELYSSKPSLPPAALRSRHTGPDIGAMTSQDLLEIEAIVDVVGGFDVSNLDDAGLRHASALGRRLERVAASLLVKVAQRSKQLSAMGSSVDPVQAMLGGGEVSNRRARADAARAEVAETLPELGEALQRGHTSGEHLDAVARATADLSETEQEGLAAIGHDISEAAKRLPVDTFNRHLRSEVDRLRGDGGLVRHEQMRADSDFRHWIDGSGMGHLRGRLDPERYEIVVGAVEGLMKTMVAAAKNDESSDPLTLDGNLAAAALVELVSGSGSGPAAGHVMRRSHIDLVVDAKTMQGGRHDASIVQTSAGTEVPLETVQRHVCNSTITAVISDSRYRQINVGRKYRTATDAQWSAIRALYSCCAWPGCDRPIDWCQAHHILFWEHDGLTDFDNLIPLCSHHHHQVHEGRWGLRLSNERVLDVYRPDGDLLAIEQTRSAQPAPAS